MRPDEEHAGLRATERTLRNVRRARSHMAGWGVAAIFWKFWTDETRWRPVWADKEESWWEAGGTPFPVRVRRWYWLRFGVAIVIPIEKGDES